MKTIVNSIIPFPGYIALTVWPWVFVRRKAQAWYTPTVDRHERTHGRQQKEMLVVGSVLAALLLLAGCGWWSIIPLGLFFEWYFMEWLFRSVQYGNMHTGYRNISMEREAYAWQDDIGYLDQRRPFAWVKYLRLPKTTLKEERGMRNVEH